MTERSCLGRGYEPTPGKPFGYAWHAERDEIRAHLRRRIWKFGFDNLRSVRLEQRVTQIQQRLHRHKPTTPFGYAWHAERDEIRAHLKARGRWHNARDEFAVTRIQQRLHRHKPTMRERQAAWLARQPKPTGSSLTFTREELERIAEHFSGANDPVTASIATKAQEALDKR